MLAERNTSKEFLFEREVSRGNKFNWKVRYYDSLSSTMEAARNLIAEVGPDEYGVVMAEEQTAGRGRRGNRWEPTVGGLYYTVVIPLSDSLESVASFTMVTGVVAAEFLQKAGALVLLKWPNDLMGFDGKKIGGILTDLVTLDRRSYLLVGVGMNVAEAPQELEKEATSINRICTTILSAFELGVTLSKKIVRAHRDFTKNGFEAYREKWLERNFHKDSRMVITSADRRYEGMFCGITEKGELLLDCGETVEKIISGHVENISHEEEDI